MRQEFALVSCLEKIERRFQVQNNPHTIMISASLKGPGGETSFVITNENLYELQVIKFGITPLLRKDSNGI